MTGNFEDEAYILVIGFGYGGMANHTHRTGTGADLMQLLISNPKVRKRAFVICRFEPIVLYFLIEQVELLDECINIYEFYSLEIEL